jgi:hypothetical protein
MYWTSGLLSECCRDMSWMCKLIQNVAEICIGCAGSLSECCRDMYWMCDSLSECCRDMSWMCRFIIRMLQRYVLDVQVHSECCRDMSWMCKFIQNVAEIPYILESNPHLFYSFRGSKKSDAD